MRLPKLTRRRVLLAAGGTVATGFAAACYARFFELHWLEVVRRDLPIAGLPAELAGKSLLQLSDLHVCPMVDPGYLAGALRLAAALQPDVLVATGDFITALPDDQTERLARTLENLAVPPLGAFAVLGNHDYGPGWKRPEVADAVARVAAAAGLTVLRNQVAEAAGLQIVGVDDLWGTNFRPATALAQVDWSRPALTLCHNPDGVDLPHFAAVRGWTLSGHTHGGQCKPPFLPPPILPVANRRYVAGAYDVGPGRRLYINRGLGSLRPFRFNARPELTLFRMTPA